ncbi:COMM domain-containing protein 5 [Sciurus carolinensis]|uniref:COMM domain-containing protein 5 n=1 Tax=Sciurus carolinensis TaxID=30640 RepID=A0AA41SXL4_SCICA|nr:COMM domain-containing protein 5 [Sciurus carolinensis]
MARFLGDRSTFRKLLKLVVSSLQGEDYREAMQCQGVSSSLSEEWRVDVVISTSALTCSLQPNILMQLKLSDGSAYRFEVPTAKFQKLWYNVALVLKEMADLERRCECRLQD